MVRASRIPSTVIRRVRSGTKSFLKYLDYGGDQIHSHTDPILYENDFIRANFPVSRKCRIFVNPHFQILAARPDSMIETSTGFIPIEFKKVNLKCSNKNIRATIADNYY